MDRYLIVGLGNPGEKYKNNKHNIGFISLDYFSNKNEYFFDNNIFNGSFYKIKNNNNEIYILKPQTFMNLSGECVFSFANFYKIDVKNILIIYDDLDLSFGKIRIRKSGSSGGQNGMKNIINKFGTENIKRLKIGIGRPTNKNSSISNYVLSDISESEKEILSKSLEKISNIIEDFYKKDFEKILMEFNNG